MPVLLGGDYRLPDGGELIACAEEGRSSMN